MRPVITLLTDFGTADGYVGELKGVLLASVPDANVVDISHDVERHDANGARLALARYWRRYPRGTIHIVVVDPGVGSSRAAIGVESEGHYLLGPDNGVLSPALLHADARVVRMPVPPGSSNTFHGRDVFAPAAASIATGMSLDAIGEQFDSPVVLRTPEPHRDSDGGIVGEIIHVDRFGNAITNIIALRGGVCMVGAHTLPVCATYASVAVGDALALTGSNGLLEIAVREGNAAAILGLARGDAVRLVSA